MTKCFDSISEKERAEIFESTSHFREVKAEVESILTEYYLEPLGRFGREEEAHPDNEFNFKDPIIKPFTIEVITRLNEIEMDCYDSFVVKLTPILKKVQHMKKGLMNILKIIMRLWDSGEEIKTIKMEIVKSLKEYMIYKGETDEAEISLISDFSEPRIEMFANELFVSATSHKPERIRLDKTQLALLEERGKDHSRVNGEQCFCLDDENGESDCCLPCCFQCLHSKCAASHFKRQVECPYCKKDLRTILEEPLKSPKKKRRIKENENENNSNEEDADDVEEDVREDIEEDVEEDNSEENHDMANNLMNVINNVRDQILNQRETDMNVLGEFLHLAGVPDESDENSGDSSYSPSD
jgi:hypothetical protein